MKAAEKNKANNLEHNLNCVKEKSNRFSEKENKTKHGIGSNRESFVREMSFKPSLKKNWV